MSCFSIPFHTSQPYHMTNKSPGPLRPHVHNSRSKLHLYVVGLRALPIRHPPSPTSPATSRHLRLHGRLRPVLLSPVSPPFRSNSNHLPRTNNDLLRLLAAHPRRDLLTAPAARRPNLTRRCNPHRPTVQ